MSKTSQQNNKFWESEWFLEWLKLSDRDYHGARIDNYLDYSDIENRLRLSNDDRTESI